MGRIHGVSPMLPRLALAADGYRGVTKKNTGARVPLNQANVLLNQAPLNLRR